MGMNSLDMARSHMENYDKLEDLKSFTAPDKNKIAKLDKEKKEKEADEVAKEFETLFVDMMLKSMRQTIKSEDETNAEGIYKSMLDNEYSKLTTDAQSFGIREMVKKWIVENS